MFYAFDMTEIATEKLEQAVELARTMLSPALQDELAARMVERISYLAQSRLTPEQRTEIRRRLAEPAVYATDEQMVALFARYRATYRTTL